MTSSASRERILSRIRAARKSKKPLLPSAARPIFPSLGDLAARFELECRNNCTECIFTSGVQETRERMRELIASVPDGTIFAEDSPDLRDRISAISRDVRWSSAGPAPESSAATITRVEALIAATGSLLVSSRCAGRAASVVAPVHVVIARRDQLLPDVAAALELVQARRLSDTDSFVGIVTGCSRTADIEKLLVMGAHGPKRLVAIVEASHPPVSAPLCNPVQAEPGRW